MRMQGTADVHVNKTNERMNRSNEIARLTVDDFKSPKIVRIAGPILFIRKNPDGDWLCSLLLPLRIRSLENVERSEEPEPRDCEHSVSFY